MYQWIRRGLFPVFMLGIAVSGPSPGAAPPAEGTAFVNSAAQAGMMEIQAGKLALDAAASAAVKTFAARMIADHERIHAELAAIARSKQIPVPAVLDVEHAGVVTALTGRTGNNFDTAYAAHMVEGHAKVVELFQANVSQPDGELAAFTGKTLAILQEHKRLADNLNSNLRK